MRLFLPLALMLAACMPQDEARQNLPLAESSLPPMKRFESRAPEPATRANADMARDFLDLAFQLESGRALPVFTRFEEPIAVKLTGASTASLRRDLSDLLARLRNEARIDIFETRDAQAQIFVESVPRSAIRRTLPNAACFVLPNVASLAQYRSRRNAEETQWANLRERRQLTIVLPSDSSPQEARDCLHEELAQALGPLNDLYRLTDSVFNDDNAHAVLTGFDMLMLRAFYDPALETGMTRAQVAARIPDILDRLNPKGRSVPRAPLAASSRAWIDAIQPALSPFGSQARRVTSARRALKLAEAEGWQDHRLAFSHFALGRLVQNRDPAAAQSAFLTAERLYRQNAITGPHRAIIAGRLAALALAQGAPETALKWLEPALPIARRYQDANRLATLLMIKAEAHAALGQQAQADAARLDSLGWARYGFGPDWAVRAKLRDVAALPPKTGSF